MIRWAVAALFSESGAALASALGVGAALILVVVIQSVFAGESEQIVGYIEHAGADVWVLQDGVANVHMATSVVSREAEAGVRAVAGVEDTVPLLYVNATVQAGNAPSWFAYLVSVPSDSSMGGVWSPHSGASTPSVGEVVVPRELARRDGLVLGDEIVVAGREMRVGGVAEGAFSMANSLLFVHRQDAIEIAGSGSSNYVLVRVSPTEEPARVARRIEQNVEGVTALTRAELRDNDYQIAIQMGGELILIMLLIGAGVAALTVSWTVSSFVSRHSRELAMAKALGANPPDIIGAVLMLTVIIAVGGYALALMCAAVLEPTLAWLAPEVVVRVRGADLARLGAVSAAVALASSLLPARRVLVLDPAQVFS